VTPYTSYPTPGSLTAARRLVALAALAACVGNGPSLAQGDASSRATVVARPGTGQLPTLGDGSELGSSAERRLGDRIAREIYRDPDYIDDPVLFEYVDTIWQPLLAAARSRGEISAELDERFAWEIMLGRDRTINAFAMPGGYMGLHLGLIGVVTSRDELASVLAHELSHITQRHISRLMTKQSAQGPWVIGAMILGALAASKSPEAANAMIAGGQAVAMQNQLNFSRDMEREADRVGFGVMTQAGFAPHGFATMFDKLQQASRLNDNGAFPYLRSHPLTTERIADVQARQPVGQPALTSQDMAMDHAMVSARARILSNPGVDLLRHAVAEASAADFLRAPPARQAAALYGAALASARLRDFSTVRTSLAQLSELTRPFPAADRLTRLLAGELSLDAGQPAASMASGGRPELFLNAQSLTRFGRAGEAIPALQTWLARHPRDAGAWQLLAGACAAQGLTLRSIRAEAEVQVAQLDYAAAADRFKAAQALVHNTAGASIDHIEASIIDTRARAVQSVLREQALER
jgi:predicted Zn-dependent protease